MEPELSPPLPAFSRAADELTTLTQMLDYHRAVLERKASGLDQAALAKTLAPSDLTLAGLVHHMSWVEDLWFVVRFRGNAVPEPWASVDWEADEDWDLHHAVTLSPGELFARFDASVRRARDAVMSADALDQLVAMPPPSGDEITLRWIMVHMIEEYARHCGHADFLRQAIDGVTGD